MTVWDDELDINTLEERQEFQVSGVIAYLNVSGAQLQEIFPIESGRHRFG